MHVLILGGGSCNFQPCFRGQSFLCRREGVGHVFFINHISKCSGPPPPILFDQSLTSNKEDVM